ncbi:MAG TPA: PDZ domain-containing protein [Phycisphaerales bacterium]|nr:PDZ domain-containing protein [Phycisphaerales bacterium]HMP35970.1 PDZ domain-containing protein [Phycisphaerales bacterium]
MNPSSQFKPSFRHRSPGAVRVPMASLAALLSAALCSADVVPDAAMLRFPDIGPEQIVFVYANDLWLVPREGGVASPLASPPGQELFPKFSPDGKSIAFVGNYDGNRDLYIMPAAGGPAQRVTHHPAGETLCDFAPDGRLIYYTNGLAGLARQNQLFIVPATGGMPEQLPVPYGTTGAISPDGTWLAYTPHTTDFRTWKRYRGGMATDIWLVNLRDGSSRQMTDWEGTDTTPMWIGDQVYYLSDEGPEHRLNIWVFDPRSGTRRQVTRFDDFDIKWPSAGPGPDGRGEIVFQRGTGLFVLDVPSGRVRQVQVRIPGDRPKLRPQLVDAATNLGERAISPTGKRVAVSARGDIWTAPAEHGSPRNLTRTSGAFERSPSWSPDGRWIAYLSDESGEYEFYLIQSDGKGEPKRITHDGEVFRFGALWAPDSSKFLFSDKTGALWLHVLGADDAPGTTTLIDRDPWASGMSPSWSGDSRWIAYQRSGEQRPLTHIRLHDTETGTSTPVTAGMFGDRSPTFDRAGDWLYFASGRSISSPMYEDLGTTFIYGNTEVLAAVPLRNEVKNPFLPKTDEETWKKDTAEKKEGNGGGDEKDESGDGNGAGEGEQKKEGDGATPAKEQGAPDDGISGTWELRLSGVPEMPTLTATMVLTLASDGSLRGSISSMMGNVAIDSGRWDRDARRLQVSFATPDGGRGSLSATVEGESLRGEWSIEGSPMAGSFTGTRTEKAAPPAEGDAAKPAAESAGSKPAKRVEIDLDGFEARAILLPVAAGNFGTLDVNDGGALLYVRRPGRGSGGSASIKLFDLKDEKHEEKTVAPGGGFQMSADGKRILVGSSIHPASANASGKPIVTAGMRVSIDPREEWAQMVRDAWRIFRDWFYDPNMHAVDWEAIGERYAKMVDDCASREDVSFVISEMISELNVGHAYYQGGGAVESAPSIGIGLLGCDFELVDGAYRIASIVGGAAWDLDARGPLGQPGLDVKEGDFLLAVNGVPVDATRDPWAAFVGLVGRPVTLTLSSKPTLDDEARDVVVTPRGSEGDLRFRGWIERNRAYVAEKTDGKVGYIYVPNTGVDGQNELFRQFIGQRHLPALIIDERWNGGGQIPTRFIELLNRPIVNYWARRDGNDWPWPPDGHQGPKCMLINGLAGSGGDAFPHYFREAGLGKLIGTRTWGGLVGISGNPGLIDGASIAVPTFAFYERDGTWGIEGHGVDPDIEIVDDPALMRDGGDPQLDAAIALMLEEIRDRPYTPPARPAYPDRSGMGIPESDR